MACKPGISGGDGFLNVSEDTDMVFNLEAFNPYKPSALLGLHDTLVASLVVTASLAV